MNKISLISLVLVLSACANLHRFEAQNVTLQSEQKRFLLLDSRIVESSQNTKLEVGKAENWKYTALPLGAIPADGILLKMLKTQRDGLSGNIDSVYSVVCGSNNGWLGGTGDGWERGPYWLDGLVWPIF